ncbi:hypothetical protein, partial [Cellulosimicrobium funkei]|uniref:hypothetical protein n=1 Tax=Cellulosimicrobium funkei TaxID=264251 RepID=UPI003F92CD95
NDFGVRWARSALIPAVPGLAGGAVGAAGGADGTAGGGGGDPAERAGAGGELAAVGSGADAPALSSWTAVVDDARSMHPSTFFEVPVSPA